ncbi:bifunctional aminoglycoside phosphotransferase/ATP-binding protein [soil metagenome]
MIDTAPRPDLDDITRALHQPAIYPNQPAAVEVIETHASIVFIAGDHVYKLKKPVDFGFLDYSTLARRRLMCQLEVQLNRRLAPNVYLGIEKLVLAGDAIQFGETGEAFEYLVHMRRLPDEATLAALVDDDTIDERQIDDIASTIGRFHQRMLGSPEIDRWGRPAAIEQNVEENLEQIQPFVGRSIPSGAYERIASYARGFLTEQHGLLNQRVLDGMIRDGHGDIRSDHVYLLDDVTIIDCIEFNDRIRYGDVATDVGFLAMDLDARNRPDLSDRLISAYVAASRLDVTPVLDFYRSYRAVVRGKVASFQLDQDGLADSERTQILREARRYFHLAYRYSTADRGPRLILMSGLTGSGKSTLARELTRALPAAMIDSDTTRKQLAGVSPTDRESVGYGEGIYSKAMTGRVYLELLTRARRLLKRGQTVILDATYTRQDDRRKAQELALELGAQFLITRCEAPEEVTRSRLAEREGDPSSVSDGRWDIYLAQRAAADPLSTAEASNATTVNTNDDLDDQVEAVLHHLESSVS